MADEIIAAIATPPGCGGIGVVRISGPNLRAFLRAVVQFEVEPRRAMYAAFRNTDATTIDHGLVLYFPAPQSYTGEDVVELQAHGGPVVLHMLLARCVELGARIAEPGEFTRRAFLNDKIDLAQAESVADLIGAATEEAARCALRSLQGEFSAQIEAMVEALIELRTFVEATLDFPEDDVDFLEQFQARTKLDLVRQRLSQVIAASRQGNLLREGAQVVLAGAPNVGKSSLLNRLAGAERAIVTDIPGTTRDTIREVVSVQGLPLHLIDTAGLREPHDAVEKIGISKTWEAVSKADLVLWISDATRPETRQADAALLAHLPAGVAQLKVVNKLDLLIGGQPFWSAAPTGAEVHLSAKTGAGMDMLQSAILEAIGWSSSGEGAYMARARHLQALHAAAIHLDVATKRVAELDLLAEELKLAQHELSGITGEYTADDLLGEIFSHFCIGK